MKTYQIILTGKTPLLMHSDNIEWADFMDEWQSDPDNKAQSKKGDDRTPAWRWLGSVYHDGSVIGIPAANIMRSLMEGGAMVPVPGGKMGKTFKSQTQSGMMCVEPQWPLLVAGSPIKWADIEVMREERKFTEHKRLVESMGFTLHVKRAKIGAAKHVRVRPQFTNWTAQGSVAVWDEQIDQKALERIFEYSGQYKGLGDWRPGGRTPGPHGTFEAKIQ